MTVREALSKAAKTGALGFSGQAGLVVVLAKAQELLGRRITREELAEALGLPVDDTKPSA